MSNETILSLRERQALKLRSNGNSYSEVAEKLGVKQGTALCYISRAKGKLGCGGFNETTI